MILSFLITFGLTVVIECSIALLLFRRKEKLKVIFYVFLINLITQPAANFLFNFLGINFFLIEALVFIVEGFLICIFIKVSLPKAMVASIAINLPTALIALVLILSSNQPSAFSSCAASADVKGCIHTLLLKDVWAEPATTSELEEDLYNQINSGNLNLDGRVALEDGHDLGMELASKGLTIDQIVADCSLRFKQSCIHGGIMEYLDNNKSLNIYSFCDYSIFTSSTLLRLNCLHAIGHIITARTIDSLNDMLAGCDFLTNKDELSACRSGVIMEYSKGEAGSGEHSHDPIFTISIDCSTVDQKYFDDCRASVGSYSQYYPDKEPIQKSFDRCSDLDKNSPTPICAINLVDRLVNASADNPDRMFALCNSADNSATRNKCLDLASSESSDLEFVFKMKLKEIFQ